MSAPRAAIRASVAALTLARACAFAAAFALLVLARAVHAAPTSAPVGSASSEARPDGAIAEATKTEAGGVVRLRERKVFSLAHDHEGTSAAERARRATQALERAFDAKEDDAHVEHTAHGETVFVGKAPIVELDADDAQTSSGASLDVYAAEISAKVKSALVQERKRTAIANSVFSFALVVFSGLIAFLLLGKARDLSARAHDWVEDHPERVPSLRVGGIELLRANLVESLLTIGIDVAKRVIQFGALYAWALFSFSLFEATKSLTERLTGLVLGPLSTAVIRVGTSLPLALAATIALFAIVLVVRFTGMFFDGVVRGETSVDWVPQDLAAPVSVLVRLGIVVGGLVLAAPLLTGSDDGVLSRLGVATLVAFALAATPVLASVVVGTIVVFGRRLRAGDFVEIAGRSGKVRTVTLLDLTVEDDTGGIVRVPHLLALYHPTRVVGPAAVVSVEIVVDAKASHAKVRELLLDVATKAGAAPRVDLVSLDADGALYRVVLGVVPELAISPSARRSRSASRRTVMPGRPTLVPGGVRFDSQPMTAMTPLPTSPLSGAQLLALMVDALGHAGVALGRRTAPGPGGASR